jgi:hypothetical protein
MCFLFFFRLWETKFLPQRRREMTSDTARGPCVLTAIDSCSALQSKNLSLGSLDSQTPPGSSRTRNISLSLSLISVSLISLSHLSRSHLALSLARSLARSLTLFSLTVSSSSLHLLFPVPGRGAFAWALLTCSRALF